MYFCFTKTVQHLKKKNPLVMTSKRSFITAKIRHNISDYMLILMFFILKV